MQKVVFDPNTGKLAEVDVTVGNLDWTLNYFKDRVKALVYLGDKLKELDYKASSMTTFEYASYLESLGMNIAWENTQLESALKSIKSKLPLSHLKIEQVQ